MNIQAVCDSKCRFVSVSVCSPGGTNDLTAFRNALLHDIHQQLPLGYYLVGDNAYVCSERMITPFKGVEKDDPHKDAFNYFLSEIRIRIEMTFGFLTNKWRILWEPLKVKLDNTGALFMCITRLHNFVINEDLEDPPAAYERILTENEQAPRIFLTVGTDPRDSGNSQMRDLLLQKIADRNLTRPTHNLERNK